MDKKNFALGMICLCVAFALMQRQGRIVRDTSEPPQAVSPRTEVVAPSPLPLIEESILPHVGAEENDLVLENDAVRVHFTPVGGAVRSVELKRYPARADGTTPYVFNEGEVPPALGLLWGEPLKYHLETYVVDRFTTDELMFSHTDLQGNVVVRHYRLAAPVDHSPYLIHHETTVRSVHNSPQTIFFNLGNFRATAGDTHGEYLNFGYYNGKKAEFVRSRDFSGNGGLLGFGSREARSYVLRNAENIRWGSIKNQFFTAILTSTTPATTFLVRPTDNPASPTDDGIGAMLGFCRTSLGETVFKMSYYVGPKDFLNLNRMGEEQDLVMELGFFGAISKILLLMMVGIHRVIPNWGWTIIALTVFIKLLMWPLTSAQVRSAKRMSAIQKPLQELREKHSGNSQKLQSETMRLFKENKVNPAMGCLPLFIQLPIFIGLYVMLRTSSEMRFQKFLWIRDLSVPDTVAHIGSFPINILPLVMGLTMFLQMRLTPTPTADGTQQKILQCMPFIFLFFCYGFPAALVLYWTVQNVLTIVQQLLTQSSIDAEIPTILDGKKRRKRSN